MLIIILDSSNSHTYNSLFPSHPCHLKVIALCQAKATVEPILPTPWNMKAKTTTIGFKILMCLTTFMKISFKDSQHVKIPMPELRSTCLSTKKTAVKICTGLVHSNGNQKKAASTAFKTLKPRGSLSYRRFTQCEQSPSSGRRIQRIPLATSQIEASTLQQCS